MYKKATFSMLGLVIFASLTLAKESKTYQETITFRSKGEIQVVNSNGEIQVEAWDQDTIELQYVMTARGPNAAEKISKVDIVMEKDGGRFSIKTVLHKKLFSFGSSNVTVNYTLKVPRQSNLELRNTNGEVRVTGVAGDLRLQTTNGGIFTSRTKGRFIVETTNGSINADVLALDGDRHRFETTNGDVQIRLAANLACEIDAAYTNGGFFSDLPTSGGNASRGSYKGRMNGDGPLLKLETTNGSIHIKSLGDAM